jgi:hypothetical protein
MISYVLCNLPFSRNQPLGMADDLHTGILKNETVILKSLRGTEKNKKIGSCDLN